MVGATIGIFYFGNKRGTPNTVLWAAFPFLRGIHWLVEYIADISETPGTAIYFDRLELALAVCSSCVLLAASLEFNGTIPRPWGKLTAGFCALTPLYFLLILSDEVIIGIEDTKLFEGFLFISDPFRLLYGFLLPIIAALGLLFTYLYQNYQREEENPLDPKLKRITQVLVFLLLFFSLFEGLDYENQLSVEQLFVALRAVSLTLFIIVPVLVILSSDMGLKHFLIIQDSGILLFAYDFETNSETKDNSTVLTAGLLTALISFAKNVSKVGNLLKIHSNNLFYIILKKEDKIYAIQSILYRRDLETQFTETTIKLTELLADTDDKLLRLGKFTVDINNVEKLINSGFTGFS